MLKDSVQASTSGRPVVFDYGAPQQFFSDLYRHYKMTRNFSLRQRTNKVAGCSQTLVSQILNGKRKINRENLIPLAEVFQLTNEEIKHLDDCITIGKKSKNLFPINSSEKKQRTAQNHILKYWINPYIKDLIHLRGFSLDSARLFSMLKGVANENQIKKSIDFLISEGFWKTTPSGELVPAEEAVVSTNEIPNEKIKNFHKKALEIAKRGLTAWPTSQRKASTVILSVNEEQKQELRDLIDTFQSQLLQFIESHPRGEDSLVQVTVHLTPIGDKLND